MIQLQKFIPEIKIQPNNIRYPKIGNIYFIDGKYMLSNTPSGEYKVSNFNASSEDNTDEWYIYRIKSIGHGFWVDKEQFEQWVKLGIIKYLRSEINEIKIRPQKPSTNEELLRYFKENKIDILNVILSTTSQNFYKNNQLYLVNRWKSMEPEISNIKYKGAIEITDHLHTHYLYLSLISLEDSHFGKKMEQYIKFKGITIYYSF